MQTIIFGTKRLGRSDEAQTNEKYPGKAVVTIEAEKEGGRSRRILFNKTAASLLSLESGSNQEIVFGTVVDDVAGFKSVLLANAALIPGDSETELKRYRTSKNPVSFEDTKEKGKAISSTTLSTEIAEFLGLSNDVEHEFSVSAFNEASEIESFKLEIIKDSTDAIVEEVAENEGGHNVSNDAIFNPQRAEVASVVREELV